MTIEEIEAKFKELEDAMDELNKINEGFNDFIESLKEMVY